MCRYRGGDEVVARGQKQQDTIPFAHTECAVDLAPSTPHGLNALVVLALLRELGVLLVQPLPLCLELEPSGLELLRDLIYDGGRSIVVDRRCVLVVHEDFLGGVMTPRALVLIGDVGEHQE